MIGARHQKTRRLVLKKRHTRFKRNIERKHFNCILEHDIQLCTVFRDFIHYMGRKTDAVEKPQTKAANTYISFSAIQQTVILFIYTL